MADSLGVLLSRVRAQSLVELGLIAPVLLLLLALTVDLGRVFSMWVVLHNAAREGAYVASYEFSGNTPNLTVSNAVLREGASAGVIASEVTISYSAPLAGDSAGVNIVNVAVTHPFQFLTPLVGSVLGNSINVTGRADFPVRVLPSALSAVPPSTATPTPLPTNTLVPTATPTSAVPPTATPLPAATPTSTAVPTATPLPTATPTSTPVPTATPLPTATPTSTPVPTATPLPTATPTSTPVPTNTPLPTATPTPYAVLGDLTLERTRPTWPRERPPPSSSSR